jgi:hypothetical protein
LKKKERYYLGGGYLGAEDKKYFHLWARGIEQLPSKHKALCSNPSTTKKRKEIFPFTIECAFTLR